MTAVRPLRALRYDPARVDLSRVIVPPYDVIAGDERGTFFERDPHNAIRFELTRDVAQETETNRSCRSKIDLRGGRLRHRVGPGRGVAGLEAAREQKAKKVDRARAVVRSPAVGASC